MQAYALTFDRHNVLRDWQQVVVLARVAWTKRYSSR